MVLCGSACHLCAVAVSLQGGSLYAVHMLVDGGADVGVASTSGKTAMHYAAGIGAS